MPILLSTFTQKFINFAESLQTLKAFQLRKLLHELLHTMLLKLYCNLGVIPISFAAKDGTFSIFRMANPAPLLQARLSRRLRDHHFRARKLRSPSDFLPARRKEARNVVQ